MSALCARTKPPPGIWGFRAPVCRRSVHETPGQKFWGFRAPSVCRRLCCFNTVSMLFQYCFNTVSILFQYCFNAVSYYFWLFAACSLQAACCSLQAAACRLQAAACSLQPAGNPLGLERPRICKNLSFFDDFSNPYTLSSKSYTLSSKSDTLSCNLCTLSGKPRKP